MTRPLQAYWLIRLDWESRVTNRTPVIAASSFEPRDNEEGGISFLRRSCLANPLDALKPFLDESKRARYTIVLVNVALLRRWGHTVCPDPRSDVSGHVLVPEINSIAYKASRNHFKAEFLELAIEASLNISRRPLV